MSKGGSIDVVWGRPDAGVEVEHGDPVCVAREADGTISAVASVAAADLPLIGGRRFWVYRAPEGDITLLRAAFAALDAAYDGSGPLGLCLLSDPDDLVARPEAAWEDPPLVHAGYLPNGREVRIGYFHGARVGA